MNARDVVLPNVVLLDAVRLVPDAVLTGVLLVALLASIGAALVRQRPPSTLQSARLSPNKLPKRLAGDGAPWRLVLNPATFEEPPLALIGAALVRQRPPPHCRVPGSAPASSPSASPAMEPPGASS